MKNIYQHFRREEEEFIDQIFDWINQVENQYTPYLTRFLNPREIHIVKSVIGQYEEINYQIFGGYINAEQQRLFIYPLYYEPNQKDFEIQLLEIIYPVKFTSLSHGQVLGTILGTGISRGNLGDILTDSQRWQFLIDEKMKDFVILNVNKIGRTNVELKEIPLENLVKVEDKWQPKEIVVSSLRLDVVLARSLNLSRNQAKQLINKKNVKINWAEVEELDIEVDKHDIISIRGYGRLQIRHEKGTTRKNNLILEIGIIDRNT